MAHLARARDTSTAARRAANSACHARLVKNESFLLHPVVLRFAIPIFRSLILIFVAPPAHCRVYGRCSCSPFLLPPFRGAVDLYESPGKAAEGSRDTAKLATPRKVATIWLWRYKKDRCSRPEAPLRPLYGGAVNGPLEMDEFGATTQKERARESAPSSRLPVRLNLIAEPRGCCSVPKGDRC